MAVKHRTVKNIANTVKEVPWMFEIEHQILLDKIKTETSFTTSTKEMMYME